ncbi:MAG: triose-phosphate isomerase [Nitrospirota bacterium]|nr:MAG: triose-phosphate isomerase [Nitrospirota bacterium]
MRRPVIAANWKMYKTREETSLFIREFLPTVSGIDDVDIIISPPFTSLALAADMVKGSNVQIAAQNIHFESEGAYTGEISSGMIVDAGCSYVIIGHSERRQYFAEDDGQLNRKVKAALGSGLSVIFCVGETIEEREEGKTNDIVGRELVKGLEGVDMVNVSIAYEPIWAIGTGKTATPEQAQEVHRYIREKIAGFSERSEAIRILYGGSVKPANVRELMSMEDIDGALVGGASLDPVSFSQIVKYKS